MFYIIKRNIEYLRSLSSRKTICFSFDLLVSNVTGGVFMKGSYHLGLEITPFAIKSTNENDLKNTMDLVNNTLLGYLKVYD
eukprot:snap_masked-scaffold_18-processed-gene-6.38-mRNA-1 protein AED:1.00 eAED:1.00 QI:0/0/0/0/1/1/2/0/80